MSRPRRLDGPQGHVLPDRGSDGHLPTDDALIKLLYLGCREMGRTTRAGRGGRSNYNWKIAMNQFDVMLPGRLGNA